MTDASIQISSLWRNILWQQFGATIDMYGTALLACPDKLWRGQLWPSKHPKYAEFWYIAYHTLFWLDLYFTGSLEGFAPPPPFNLAEIDDAFSYPEQPYSKDELHTYMLSLRKRCQTIITNLSDEKAAQMVSFQWVGDEPISYLELLIYTLRHVQEHGSQLNLFLGQQGVEEVSDWISQALPE